MTPPSAPTPLSPDAARQLLAELATWLRGRLRVPTKTLFDTLDDSLFELAEHSTSSERQQQYFDGMRECRRRREEIERDFLARVGRVSAPVPSVARRTDQDNLALVGHEELEENLAITSMVSRTKQRLQSPLFALDQRVGHLLGEPELEDDLNPFGPAQLCQAFRHAAANLEVSLEIRLIMFKLFERHVLGGIEPVYGDINIRLTNAGVLQTLPARVKRDATPAQQHDPAAVEEPTTAPASSAPPGTSGLATGDDARTVQPAVADPVHDLLSDLMGVLEQRIGGATGSPATPPGAGTTAGAPTASPALLQALERSLRRADDGVAMPPPRQLAAQLQAEAKYAGAGASSPSQLATVDALGRIFEALLQAGQVPRPLQPLVQRMQIPLTRSALMDPGALSRPSHPARQLMELLGDTLVGWCRSADPEGRVISDLEAFLQGFSHQDNALEQSRLISEWRQGIEAQQRRAELAEHRTVESAAGRERLWHARRQVHQAISMRLAQAPVPAWVRHLLGQPWANCMVLLWLRQGEDSAAFREAGVFADSLLWCARAGATDVEKLRLRALLPVLESQLRQGLATVAYHEAEIDQLIGELREFMRWRLEEIPAPEFLERESPSSGMGIGPDITVEQPLPDDIDQALLSRIRSVAPGTWFEFGPEQSDAFERAKLSWVSPYSGRWLFVNRNGMRVADRRPEELAKDMELGMARMIEGVNLLQAALGKILGQLRGEAAQQAGRSA